MKTLKKIWKFLDGKKSVITAFYTGAGSAIIMVWFPDGLVGIPLKIHLTIGILLGGVSVAHKGIKRNVAKKNP